jgi:hypothetical protein
MQYYAVRRYAIIRFLNQEYISFSAKLTEDAISYHPTGLLPS